MKTYGLSKDYRIVVRIVLLVISIVLYVISDYFGLSKISVPLQYTLITKIGLSLFSFTLFYSLLIFLIEKVFLFAKHLNREYEVIISSSHKDTIIEGKLTIKIGFDKAKVALKTKTSQSTSQTIFIDNYDKDKYVITYTYQNEGNYQDNKLRIHNGTCILEFSNGEFIQGKYYNDEFRKTYGSIIPKQKENVSQINILPHEGGSV